MTRPLHKIGEVSSRTGLSLRTIRYYEEVGLVVPDERSHGGFRLYADHALARFELIASLRPLDLSLEDLRTLIGALDDSAAGCAGARDIIRRFSELADVRAHELLVQSDQARSVSRQLRGVLRTAERASPS